MTRRAWRMAAFQLALGAAAWLLTGCGERVAAGGDATETGNARIAGQVVGEGGQPVAGAEVMILATDFNPVGASVPDSQKDTSDREGHYRFRGLKKGRYNLQVKHAESLTRAARFGIDAEAETEDARPDTVRPPGSMSVPLPETLDSGVGYVYVPGTTFRKRIDSELRIVGSVLLDSLPQGTLPAVLYTKGDSASRPIVIATEVAIVKSRTTRVNAYAAWTHSARLEMNTTGSGVKIGADVRDFPLLVRLASPAFDFAEAAPGGADLRFSKADGTPLPLEIESWDAQAGRGEIWVRVDTVRAASASQYITLHWGKPDAAAPRPLHASRLRPVFDTLSGFAGVWHLGEEAAGIAADGLYRDATGAGSDGDDRLSAASRAGVIGAGHGLDSGDYILSPKPSSGLKLASAFTLSIWYRTTCKACGFAGGDMLSVGDNYGLRVRKDSVVHLWYWPASAPAGSKYEWYELDAKGADFTDGNWHQVFGAFDGAVLRLYVDGAEVGNAAAKDAVGLQFPLNVTLGRHGNGKVGMEYAGDLDEAQVHSAVRDADWVKMAYQNQKEGAVFPAWVVP